MTVTQLYPPIAAATAINVFLFAFAWRGHQAQRHTGRDPWWVAPAILAYCTPLAIWFYFNQSRPLIGWVDYFFAGMTGEVMGGLIVYALLYAFLFTKGRPWTERLFPIAGALVLSWVAVSGLLR